MRQSLKKKIEEKVPKRDAKTSLTPGETQNSRPKTAGSDSTRVTANTSYSRIVSAKLAAVNQSILNKSTNENVENIIDMSFEQVNGSFHQRTPERLRKVPKLNLQQSNIIDNNAPKPKQTNSNTSTNPISFKKFRSSSFQAKPKADPTKNILESDPRGPQNFEKAINLFSIQEKENKSGTNKSKIKRSTNISLVSSKKPIKTEKIQDSADVKQPTASTKKTVAKRDNSGIKRKNSPGSKVNSQPSEPIKKKPEDRKSTKEPRLKSNNPTPLKQRPKSIKVDSSCTQSNQTSLAPTPRPSVLNTERVTTTETEREKRDQGKTNRNSVSPLKKSKVTIEKPEPKLQNVSQIGTPIKLNTKREKVSEIMVKACDY